MRPFVKELLKKGKKGKVRGRGIEKEGKRKRKKEMKIGQSSSFPHSFLGFSDLEM
jgi:hypothetical protein